MPLARYFLYVGGALLALLFISDPYLPKLQVADWGNSRPAIIHIQSDQKWPERIVYDTSLPTAVPAQITNIEANVAPPEIVPSATEREAFAQLQPSSQLSDAKKARTEAATPTQNCKKTRRPACTLGNSARAIWLVWQPHLVSG
jgi:hypothetical protein